MADDDAEDGEQTEHDRDSGARSPTELERTVLKVLPADITFAAHEDATVQDGDADLAIAARRGAAITVRAQAVARERTGVDWHGPGTEPAGDAAAMTQEITLDDPPKPSATLAAALARGVAVPEVTSVGKAKNAALPAFDGVDVTLPSSSDRNAPLDRAMTSPPPASTLPMNVSPLEKTRTERRPRSPWSTFAVVAIVFALALVIVANALR